MRAVIATDAGVLEVNWQWLPTWIGMNTPLLKEIEDELKDKVVGRTFEPPLYPEAVASQLVIDFLVARHPGIEGLDDYLDGLKFVRIR